MGRRVLITGISRHLGARLAQRLERDPGVDAVVGVDLEEPELDLERTTFVRADIRNPLVVSTFAEHEIDTLVHLSIISTPTRVGGRSAMKEINVMGSLHLFAVAGRVPTLRKVVMKSSTAVYGSSPSDPAVFTEDMAPRDVPRHGYVKDSIEVEQFARDFGRRRPDVALTVLRFANFMGSDIETTLTRYFSLPVIPVPAGFDPRIQLVHERDAEEVLYRSVVEEHPGLFNVTADGVVLLSQAVRICGKLPAPVPLPLAMPVARLVRRFGRVDFPTDQLPFLVYGRVADNARLRAEFGIDLRYDTRAALGEFVEGHRFRRFVTPQVAEGWEEGVLHVLRAGSRRSREEAGR